MWNFVILNRPEIYAAQKRNLQQVGLKSRNYDRPEKKQRDAPKVYQNDCNNSPSPVEVIVDSTQSH